MHRRSSWPLSVPGLCLSGAVAVAAVGLERLEIILFGRAWLEALVLAIVLGAAVRTAASPADRFRPGIACAAKTLLEFAIMLMGATVSFQTVMAAGLPLLAGIVLTVFGSIAAGVAIGSMLGLPRKMALLVACGNSICGNSAIAAVAPVIRADGDEVATSIAFTAVLGILVVLLLPLVALAAGLDAAASGVLAGLTVYAVPQVLAAAGPMGPLAVQMGMLVKLVRVLMLGPVVAVLGVAFSVRDARDSGKRADRKVRLLPTFIVVFFALAAVHSTGLLPQAWTGPLRELSGILTVVAMAGLGLGVDLRQIAAAGLKVSVAVILSLLTLTGFALIVIHVGAA